MHSGRILLIVTLCLGLCVVVPAMARDANDDLLQELDTELGESAPEKSGAEENLDLLDALDADLGEDEPGNKASGQDLLDELDMDLEDGKTAEDDLFKDLEGDDFGTQQAQGDGQEPGNPLLRGISEHIEGLWTTRMSWFPEDPAGKGDREVDTQEYIFESRLELATWTGTDDWRVTASGWLDAGNQKKMYAGVTEWPQDLEQRRHYAELNELYFTGYGGDADVTLGKKIFKNGISVLYSPANRYTAVEAHDPSDPRQIGRWQAQLDYYTGAFTYTGALLPVYQSSKYPLFNSRWLGESGGDYLFYDLQTGGLPALPAGVDADQSQLEQERMPIDGKNLGWFGRAKTAWRGYDLFASLYDGPNQFYVLKRKDDLDDPTKSTYVKEVVRVFNAASGFSTTWKEWEFHGEGLYNHAYSERDQNYLDYVGGLTYVIDDMARKAGADHLALTVEYAGEWITAGQHAEGYEADSEVSRPGRNDILTYADLKIDEDLSVQLAASFELNKDGNAQAVQVKRRLAEGTTMLVGLEVYGGPHESYHGRWERNKRLSLAVEYAF